jgi:dihydrofolate reductase
MTKPVLTLIAAVARNGVIGKDNALPPWRLPGDLKRFKALTMGNPIVMGRKTWQSLGRPLPGRLNIVVTRDPDFEASGAAIVHSVEEALAVAAEAPEVFVIGGAEIYALTLPRASRLQLTEVDADFDGDTYFPDWARREWRESQREFHRGDAGPDYAFVTYERI